MTEARDRLWRLLNEPGNLGGWIYRGCLLLLVLTVCVTFVIETYPISPELKANLELLDNAITILFLIDYLVRFWTEGFRIRYLFTPLAIVDLIAILPLFLSAQWQFVRILRLFRMLRFLRVLQRERPTGWLRSEFRLRMVTIFFTLFCIVFISAGLIYDIEHKNNPEQIRTFFDSLYFAIVSMTTVGYGDIVPLSTGGRAVTLLMICSGMVLIPWQLTELLRYLIQSSQKEERRCGRCHYLWHEIDAHYCKICGQEMESKSMGTMT